MFQLRLIPSKMAGTSVSLPTPMPGADGLQTDLIQFSLHKPRPSSPHSLSLRELQMRYLRITPSLPQILLVPESENRKGVMAGGGGARL